MFDNYIFDLYGTLIDINTDENSMELWEKLALLYKYKNANYTAQEIKKDYGKYVEAEKKRIKSKNLNYKNVDIKIENVFKKLFTAKKVKVTPKEIDFICTAFRCYSTVYIKLYSGVKDLLKNLKEKGKKVYLLSNAQRKFTENELNMFGLTKYFDGILISSDQCCSKPDIEFYEALFKKYNLEKDRSIMVGNDYISDIQGAYNFGIKSLYIHQSISPEIKGELKADYKIMDGNVYKIKELIVKEG